MWKVCAAEHVQPSLFHSSRLHEVGDGVSSSKLLRKMQTESPTVKRKGSACYVGKSTHTHRCFQACFCRPQDSSNCCEPVGHQCRQPNIRNSHRNFQAVKSDGSVGQEQKIVILPEGNTVERKQTRQPTQISCLLVCGYKGRGQNLRTELKSSIYRQYPAVARVETAMQ